MICSKVDQSSHTNSCHQANLFQHQKQKTHPSHHHHRAAKAFINHKQQQQSENSLFCLLHILCTVNLWGRFFGVAHKREASSWGKRRWVEWTLRFSRLACWQERPLGRQQQCGSGNRALLDVDPFLHENIAELACWWSVTALLRCP